jgi:hypothetical protein
VVENECKDSWRWFLTLLLEDIGSEKRWVFISDQQKVFFCKPSYVYACMFFFVLLVWLIVFTCAGINAGF